jgi:ribosomal subunit interface protein
MPEKNVPNVRLLCKDLNLDDRTEDYIYKRINKLERFNGKILEYEVEINMDKKGKFTIDLMVKTPYKLYRVEERSESIEGSIDIAVDEIKTQIVKDKDKMMELRERGARSLKKMTVIDDGARFRK